MDIIAGWRDVPSSAKGAVLAIGNFDGVHRGHQAVLQRAVKIAKMEAKPSGAVIFEPHPHEFFGGESFFRLTPLPMKLELLAGLGLDQTVVIEFGVELSTLSAEAFAVEVLAHGLGVATAVVGYDFAYGKGRSGTTTQLRSLGARCGFNVEIMPPITEHGTIFSSSLVRKHLREGEITEAARQLGYCWRVRGEVGISSDLGKGLGFPTISLPCAAAQALGHGIYAVNVLHRGIRYRAAGYVGSRPTFGESPPVLEACLLDDVGNLYGEQVEMEFVTKLRDDARFTSADALAAQMAADCNAARLALTGAHTKESPT